jgi:hypothetical protein
MGNLGGWVAEHHLAWCRLILWFYQDIESFAEEAIHYEDPTGNRMSWNVVELKGWLVVLQGIVVTCLDAESGPHVPMPPAGGSYDFVIETAAALSVLIRVVMNKVITQEIIDQVDIPVKRLLCAAIRQYSTTRFVKYSFIQSRHIFLSKH